MLDLLDEIVRRAAVGEPVGVCVVARTRGSTPQKAGATMLVLLDGRTLGTLGGGCVEAEVRVRALRCMTAREDRRMTFKLDHDLGWDDGLVCGGTMEVAVSVVDSAAKATPWRSAAEDLRSGRAATVTLTVPDEQGRQRESVHEFPPTPSLVIAGAGHVGQALAAIAGPLGFDVTVIDDRLDSASADRFPNARRIVGPIEGELARLPPHDHRYVVIVTRGHRHDGRALAAVVGSSARYVGLIGSRRKVLTIYEELIAQGVPADRLDRVHAPIGLGIGAITPAEIAVSIAAELVAVRRGATVENAMRLTPNQLSRLKKS